MIRRAASIGLGLLLTMSLFPAVALGKADVRPISQLEVAGDELLGDDDGLNSVQEVVEQALTYLAENEMSPSAFKGALERSCPEVLCYAIGKSRYYLLYDGGHYFYDYTSGTASPVPEGEQLPYYDTLAAAKEKRDPVYRFITGGLDAQGDGGHGCYERVDAGSTLEYASVSAWAPIDTGEPDITFALDASDDDGSWRYRLLAADGALDVRQFGYKIGDDVRPVVLAFQNTGFTTLLFPKGDHRLLGSVWAWAGDRSYYGFGAALYTDDDFVFDNTAEKGKHKNQKGYSDAIWTVRGKVTWGNPNVYETVSGITLNGLSLECRATEAEEAKAKYRYGINLCNANNVCVNHCRVVEKSVDVERRLVCLELYGNCVGVQLLNMEASGWACLEIRDLCNQKVGTRDVVVRGCTMRHVSPDEGIAIFAGNEEGLGSPDEHAIQKDSLVDTVTIEQNRFYFEPSAAPQEKERVVAITCGYQDSPVKNVTISNNKFNMYADDCLIMFGYADNCKFNDNEVELRTVKSKRIHGLVYRSSHTRTGPSTNIEVKGNTISMPDSGDKLSRLVDRAFGPEVTFAENAVEVKGSVDNLIDSRAVCKDNTFNVHKVKSLYMNVREVSGNTYHVDELQWLFEGYGVNMEKDIVISNETATIGKMYRDDASDTVTLMGFNLAQNGVPPTFNGHSMTFKGCWYDIGQDAGREFNRIASSPNLDGQIRVTFQDCYLPIFSGARQFQVKGVNTFADGSLKIVLSGTFVSADADHVHEWSEPAYSPAADGSYVTAMRSCSADGVEHVESETAMTAPVAMREPSCTEAGENMLTATFANPSFAAVQTRAVSTPALGHVDDGGKVTRAATVDAAGEITHRCTRCGTVLATESIPKLVGPKAGTDSGETRGGVAAGTSENQDSGKAAGVSASKLGVDGTAFGKGASGAAAAKALAALKSDADPVGTVYRDLKLRLSKAGATSLKLSWAKVSGAKSYVLYGNKCGKANKLAKAAQTSKVTCTVKKAGGAKLKKGVYYKFVLVALDKTGNVVSTSKVVHAATTGGKVGNASKVTISAKKSKVSLKKGRTFKLNAKAVAASKKLKVKSHRALKYETSNAKVAAVSAKGVVKAKKKGSCWVYAYAQNGVHARVKVTVK